MLPNLSRLRLLDVVPTACRNSGKSVDDSWTPIDNWIPFGYGEETMKDYSKRVMEQILSFATYHKIPLDNASGIGFDKCQIIKMVGRTALINSLEFDDLRTMNDAAHVGHLAHIREEALSFKQRQTLNLLDLMMGLLQTSASKDLVWDMLKVLHVERLPIIVQALTGTFWNKSYPDDIEKVRLKLNVAFGFYDDGLIKNGSAQEVNEAEDRMHEEFRKSSDAITQAILQRHPNAERFNGTAVRKLFSDKTKTYCCLGDTGESSPFVKPSRKRERDATSEEDTDATSGEDTLVSDGNGYLTFVHYGSDVDAAAQDLLVTNGPIYVSMSPRWKWNDHGAIFVLKVTGSLKCDLIDPSTAYAEVTIIPGNGGGGGSDGCDGGGEGCGDEGGGSDGGGGVRTVGLEPNITPQNTSPMQISHPLPRVPRSCPVLVGNATNCPFGRAGWRKQGWR